MKKFLILGTNLFIIFIVAIFVLIYVNDQERLKEESGRRNFVDSTQIMSDITGNYLSDLQWECDIRAQYLNRSRMDMNQAIAYLQKSKAMGDANGDIVWLETLRGNSDNVDAKTGEIYEADYSELLPNLALRFEENNYESVMDSYIDPETGDSIVAFCTIVRLMEHTQGLKMAVLIRTMPEKDIAERWTLPGEFDSARIGLMHDQGDFVISPENITENNFYEYLKASTKNDKDFMRIRNEMRGAEKGNFLTVDKNNTQWYYVFWSIKNTSGLKVVAFIPDYIFEEGGVDCAIPVIILSALIIIAIFNAVILYIYRRIDMQVNKQMQEQISAIRGLSTEYMTVLMTDVSTGFCQTYRVDSRVKNKVLDTRPVNENNYYEIIDAYIDVVVYEKDRENVRKCTRIEHLQSAVPSEGVYTINYRRNIDNEISYYQMIYTRDVDDKNTERFIIGTRNVDDVVKKEEEQKKLLRKALYEAENANRAKTHFLFNMSHDIRTPMNAVIGYTALAQTHIKEEEKALDYIGKIKTASDHLLCLINDILDMSRIESGKIVIESEECSLLDMLKDLSNIVENDIKHKNQKYSLNTDAVINEYVYCDRLRINQILLNCISNAMKYTPEGGAITVELCEKIGKLEGCALYIFKIRDTGIGMSKEFQKHVFEPFERERTSTVSGIQGTGLGMAITKNLVDLMNGNISVESEEGKGTEIIISLQLPIADRVESDTNTPDAEQQLESVTKTSLENMHVLLVEDNMLNREIACEILSEEGMLIDTAENGQIAVDMIKSAPAGTYELIFMDVQMPVMDGYEATRQIRSLSDAKKANIPIIAMTANAFEEDKRQAFEAGMDAHIAKPIEVDVILENINMVLSNKKYIN